MMRIGSIPGTIHAGRGRLVAAAAALVLSAPAYTQAEEVAIDHGYHFQQTAFFCGPASIQMMLDTAAVRNNNPNVVALLDNPPPPALAHLSQDQWVQLQIYYNSRFRNMRTMLGTDPPGFSLTINAYDGTPNGPPLWPDIPQGGNPNHAYAWWGFAPDPLCPPVWQDRAMRFAAPPINADLAMRTVAYAMKEYQVPATVAVNWGAHWLVVNGIRAEGGPIGFNLNYRITEVRISDPLAGLVQRCRQPNPPPELGCSGALLGDKRGYILGKEKWWTYGINAPDAQGCMRPRGFLRFFTPLPVGPFPYDGQYVIVVEPDPPAPPDDGDGGKYSSLPDPFPLLDAPLTAATVLDHLIAQLAEHDLFGEMFEEGGSFVESLITFHSFPDDKDDWGDWVIPFDGPEPGHDDIIGVVVMDGMSGVIDHAVRLEEGESFPYDDVLDFYDQLYALNLPDWDVGVELIPGDLNLDGCVDLVDLAILLGNYGMTSGASYFDGDITGDGRVGLADLSALLESFGGPCP